MTLWGCNNQHGGGAGTIAMALKRWMAQNWFLIGLVVVVLLSWRFPEPGAAGGMLRSEVFSRLGVVLIFFFQGLTLSLSVLKLGVMQWRLHLFVQIFVFLVIPLLALAMITVGASIFSEELRLGFIFLAVLPTTIATCVAYTAMTGGNVAGAVFNSTLANLSGIFITPLWIGAWLQAGGETLPLGKLFLDISLLLLAPLLFGQIVRPLSANWVDARKKYFSIGNSLIILFIVYAAFCNSWVNNIWSSEGSEATLLAAAGAVLLFSLAVGLSFAGIRIFGFEHPNAMAILFCSPQKTLAAGVPLANLIFAGHPGVGLILLPIMFYHPLQLLAGGILINRINKIRQP
jgi:solute carrier family 10 (sodium/bile acid cotransporter), member 7